MTEKPNTLPANACDCHVHLYDPVRFPVAAVVPPATWNDLQSMHQALGIQRTVLVQPLAYRFDNSCLLDGLQQAGEHARGIAVIAADSSDELLADLHLRGVRGVRLMMVPGSEGVLGWEDLETLSARIAELGWVINLQLDGRELPAFESRLSALPSRLSIDHTGKFLEPVALDSSAFKSLRRLMDTGNTWVKVSAPYETSKQGGPLYPDVSILASTLVDHYAERCLWASNWPHPGQAPAPQDHQLLELLSHWAPSKGVREQILVINPQKLYGF
ncbi:amidohydrolase family protein [Pseudomonas sp.]|jgi:D-galactarolactone isomerase|uniref:amidohydrolase family protein n=1 Tax=Pseudomonas sp. TaxID=306 RepID=UPI00257BB6A3|nr:amidohydrolase family protein [Pseudomonas sp.]